MMKYSIALFLLFFFFEIPAALASAADGQPDINQHAVRQDSVYTVQQGDTYYSLSRRFNIPLDDLQQWNGNKLQIGQQLYLTAPGAKAKNTTTTTATASADAVPAPAKAATGSTTPAPAKAATTAVAPPASAAPPKQVNQPAPASQAAPAKAAATQAVVSTSATASPLPTTAEYKTSQRILVIPFDPYLYFSDADEEIARQSKIPRQNVRQVFRGRLDAMMAPQGYESIHLLGGVYRDSVDELSRLYKSLNYSYQDNKQSKYNKQPVVKGEESKKPLDWLKRQKDNLTGGGGNGDVPVSQDPNKHYGVKVKDEKFFDYFNNQYGIDYYVFINQFEVKTNYEHCLDRAAMNYERDFMVHYSIYDNKGELVSGNKVKVPYHSNINDVQRIVSDNMPGMAKRVLADLPSAAK